jgi:hypothetical protein
VGGHRDADARGPDDLAPVRGRSPVDADDHYSSCERADHWSEVSRNKVAANGMPNVGRQRVDDVDFGAGGTLYASSHHGVYALSLSGT